MSPQSLANSQIHVLWLLDQSNEFGYQPDQSWKGERMDWNGFSWRKRLNSWEGRWKTRTRLMAQLQRHWDFPERLDQ